MGVDNLAEDGALISGYAYTYQAGGLIATETQTWTDPDRGLMRVDRAFTYDQNQRLSSYTETEPAVVPDPDEQDQGMRPDVSLPAPFGEFSTGDTTDPGDTTDTPEASQTQTVTYTFDAVGNRIQAVRTLPGDVTLKTILYTYKADDQLIVADSTLDGMTTYAYTPDGSISDAFNTDSGRVSYEWTASQRLQERPPTVYPILSSS